MSQAAYDRQSRCPRLTVATAAGLVLGLAGLSLGSIGGTARAQTYTPTGGVTVAVPRTQVASTSLDVHPVGQHISGSVEVLSPTTLNVDGIDLRLHGIIVPIEMAAQSKAAANLLRMTKGQTADCYTVGTDTDGLPLAACGAGNYPNLALALLDAGRAMVDRQQVASTPVADMYLAAERQARRADLGLWGSETGPVPVYPRGSVRPTMPADLQPPDRKPGDVEDMTLAGAGQGYGNAANGPVIRFSDGSSIDLSQPLDHAAPLEPLRAPGTVSFVSPDQPLASAPTPTVYEAGGTVDGGFSSMGLIAEPGNTSGNTPGVQQVASLGDSQLGMTAPSVSQQQPLMDANNTLIQLVNAIDQVMSQNRKAYEQGNIHLPTPPGEPERVMAREATTATSAPDIKSGLNGWLVALGALLLGALAAGVAWGLRWYHGIWPWEQQAKPDQNFWLERRRQSVSLAQALAQCSLDLSFALSERADIARLAAANPSGRSASDLRALRIDAPALIGDNWERIGQFNRQIGLRARQFHSRIAEYDRRVADLAALATEGRLHDSGLAVFSTLAERLEQMAVEARELNQETRSRLQQVTHVPKPSRPARPTGAKRKKKRARPGPAQQPVGSWSTMATARG